MLINYINGLQHIGIPTRSFESTIKFYEALDFEIVFQTTIDDGKAQVVFMQLYDIVIEIYEVDVSSNRAGAIDHIAIDVEDVESLFECMKRKDYKVLNDEIQYLPFFENGVRFFTIEGPNGEKIEFNQIITKE
jgi:catechol 2,3-dioxygenase-like lactoylglutathione lyase family enzyme